MIEIVCDCIHDYQCYIPKCASLNLFMGLMSSLGFSYGKLNSHLCVLGTSLLKPVVPEVAKTKHTSSGQSSGSSGFKVKCESARWAVESCSMSGNPHLEAGKQNELKYDLI